MITRLKAQLRFYRTYIHPVVRSKSSIMSFLVTGKETDVTFYNGLKLHFIKGDQGCIVKLARALYFFKIYGIETTVYRNDLIVELPSKEKISIDLNRFTKEELANLLQIIYYCIRFDTPVSASYTDVNKNVYPSVYFDTESKLLVIGNGIRFHLALIDPWIIVETFILRIHDKFMDSKKVKTVLDAGAAFGDTALFFSSKGHTVYSIEPIASNFDALLKNVELNPDLKDNIHPLHAAIGRDGSLEFKYESTIVDGGATAYLNHLTSDKTETVRSYSISTLCSEMKIKGIDYLKMDCKGAEFDLKKEDLDKVKYYLKLEYSARHRGQLLSLLKLLHGSGFECSIVKNSPDDETSIHVNGTIYAIRKM